MVYYPQRGHNPIGPRPNQREDTVHRIRYLTGTVLLVGLGLACNVALAGLDAKAQQEVSQLLAFVGQSQCAFIRNGKVYDGVAAKSHLETKLHYLIERGQVNSAEDFIERAATQSSFSGRPYLVDCGGNERPSADWLKEELHLLREPRP